MERHSKAVRRKGQGTRGKEKNNNRYKLGEGKEDSGVEAQVSNAYTGGIVVISVDSEDW